jgi:hypothetical protein
MKKWLLIVGIVLVPFSVWGNPPEVKPDRMVTLAFSSNVYGEIEPCG